jgi:DNA mismatch repair ATPase MutS
LAQVGLFVPGIEARISPADGIFTHFPAEDKLEQGAGRFGDEAQRLKTIFTQVTRHSLVLLNETLSSTSYGEGLYLAEDLLRVMRRLGLRAIYATHMHELAAGVERINAGAPGDATIISIVASQLADGSDGSEEPTRRSFRIRRGPSMGKSYALELARRYGISEDQLLASLGDRGVL